MSSLGNMITSNKLNESHHQRRVGTCAGDCQLNCLEYPSREYRLPFLHARWGPRSLDDYQRTAPYHPTEVSTHLLLHISQLNKGGGGMSHAA